MNDRHVLLRLCKTICLVLTLEVSMNAYGFVGDSWKEEVLLHDGSKMVVERSVERGGRHEIGQKPPYKEQSLSFTMPGTTQTIRWEDHYSQDLGHKWGRPNPPYVIFQYQEKQWKRVPLQELPAELNALNMIFSEPDFQVEQLGTRFVTAEKIKEIISGYKQPEFKTILRKAVKSGSLGSPNCEERVLYKGHWILPNDPIAREFIDRQKK
jgi:hypothetical protein